MNRVVRESGSKALSRQGEELVLPVPVGEHGEQVEVQPVVAGFVERLQDPRPVGVPAVTLEQRVCLLAPVPAEMRVQQVDHGPQVPSLLDVHLEEVPEVVEARGGLPQLALLLDAGRFRVPLGDDQAAEVGPELARNLLPHRLAGQIPEPDAPILLGRRQEDPPPVVGHPHVVEVRPTRRLDGDRGPEEHIVALETLRPHFAPPVEERGLPAEERPLESRVLREGDVVRDAGVKFGHAVRVRFQSNAGRSGLP